MSEVTLRLFVADVNESLKAFSPYSFNPSAINSKAFLDRSLRDLEAHVLAILQ